jgi:hypothetical protein
MFEIRITNLEQFGKLSRDLKAAGLEGRGLKRSLTAAARLSTKPMIEAAKESAQANLPKRGGLNEFIATARFTVSNRMSGSTAARGKGSGVVGSRIVAKKAGGRKGSHDLEAFDNGHFRHPVYGNMKKWAPQSIEPGWFTKPMQKAAPAALAEFRLSMDIIARRIEKGNF